MKSVSILVLTVTLIIALLAAGCTTQPQTEPSETVPTVSPATTPAEPSIFGTWTLVSTFSGGRAVSAVAGTSVTATFSDAGTVSGSAGCNNYVASCQVNRNTLAIGKPATGTTSCQSPTGVMDLETMYLSNLHTAASYTISGDTLTLYGTTGNILITYQRSGAMVSPLPVSGITWNLDSYRQASGSQAPVLKDTSVTAFFGPLGTINGTAGCNSYSGVYTTRGPDGISISPLATTLMYCGEPGVMDQETAYLALLQIVSSFEVTSDGALNLRDPAGTVLLEYSS